MDYYPDNLFNQTRNGEFVIDYNYTGFPKNNNKPDVKLSAIPKPAYTISENSLSSVYFDPNTLNFDQDVDNHSINVLPEFRNLPEIKFERPDYNKIPNTDYLPSNYENDMSRITYYDGSPLKVQPKAELTNNEINSILNQIEQNDNIINQMRNNNDYRNATILQVKQNMLKKQLGYDVDNNNNNTIIEELLMQINKNTSFLREQEIDDDNKYDVMSIGEDTNDDLEILLNDEKEEEKEIEKDNDSISTTPTRLSRKTEDNLEQKIEKIKTLPEDFLKNMYNVLLNEDSEKDVKYFKNFIGDKTIGSKTDKYNIPGLNTDQSILVYVGLLTKQKFGKSYYYKDLNIRKRNTEKIAAEVNKLKAEDVKGLEPLKDNDLRFLNKLVNALVPEQRTVPVLSSPPRTRSASAKISKK